MQMGSAVIVFPIDLYPMSLSQQGCWLEEVPAAALLAGPLHRRTDQPLARLACTPAFTQYKNLQKCQYPGTCSLTEYAIESELNLCFK